MRLVILAFLLLCAVAVNAQHLTYFDWQKESFRDIRLIPRYEGRQKNADMKASDSAFVAQTLAVIPSRREASDHLVDLGLAELAKGDMKSAMFRFNQAWLVEPDNADINRGFGAFFVALDRNTEAAKFYRDGLEADSTNIRMMVDLATVFLAEYYTNKNEQHEKADQFLSVAKAMFERAWTKDRTNAEVAFKLSVCNLRKGQCAEAWKFHDLCKALGGGSMSESYVEELKQKCVPPTH